MHKTLVANVSKPLDRLINGPMSEAQSGEAELEEVDGLTFTRFCQWAYAGFYPAAEFGDRPQDVALAEQTGMLNLYIIESVHLAHVFHSWTYLGHTPDLPFASAHLHLC